MVLEKMLAGLQERRAKVGDLLAYLWKMGPVDGGQDIDRLLRRFQVALEEILVDIDAAAKRSREWFGPEEVQK